MQPQAKQAQGQSQAVSASGDTLTLALGLNLWLLGLVVPVVGTGAVDVAPLCLAAPLLLVLGVFRRNEPALLVGVPLAALLPLALPQLDEARQGAVPFVLVGLGLGAYLYAALSMLAAREPRGEGVRITPLPGEPLPLRWRRRRRMYRVLTLGPGVAAVALLGVVLLPGTMQAVAEHDARPELALALLGAVAAVAWAGLVGHAILGPLAGHLELDRTIAAKLARVRRPRVTYWLISALALVLVIAAAIVLVRDGRLP